MPSPWIRSTLFNIAFFAVTALLSVLYLPALLLPRRIYIHFVKFWVQCVTVLEYGIMGIRYEVRGLEHIPAQGPYIIAAKHQSVYETLKIWMIVDDPAVILKRELLKIPVWGWYLNKSGVIAIDRSTPDKALRSIEQGALRVAAENRPIIIFPQGTRVRIDADTSKFPYKAGAARIQQATGLPIVPLALNSGLFWPRGGWLKSPGKVIFEFLPPIAPGRERQELMKDLEDKLESASAALMNEARAESLQRRPRGSILAFLVFIILFFAGYSWLWFESARHVRETYMAFLKDLAEVERIHGEPVITGWPGPIRLEAGEDTIRNAQGSVSVQNLTLRGWPVPWTAVHIKTGPIRVTSMEWPSPLAFDSLDGVVTYNAGSQMVTVKDSSLAQGPFRATAKGTINLKQEPVPAFDMVLTMERYTDFLVGLAQNKIIKDKQAVFIAAGFTMIAKDGVVTVPVTQRGQTLYAGPLAILQIPAAYPPGGPRRVPYSPPDPVQ